ncbi:MAG: hypothetical protein SH809_01605 [Rhodothermales bacterium]|nr:hypothetical protein [Rhodothermales bacterium]
MAASTRFCFTWHAGRVRYLFIAVFPVVCLAACSPTEAPMNARTDPEFNYRRTLPPLLQTESGSPVQSPESWREVRRPELVRLVLEHEYGIMPPPPAEIGVEVLQEDPAYLDGEAVKKLVRLTVGPPGTPTIDVLLIAPSGVQGASPVILALNFMGNHATIDDPTIPLTPHWLPDRGEGVVDNRATEAARGTVADRWPFREIITRGYAVATFYHGDVDPDRDDFTDGIHPHLPVAGSVERTDTSWGTLAAWAWGMQRGVDYLLQEPLVDPARIAVMGHSRNGKATLLAAATDERIALAISNQSGCGGAAISRRRVGETVEAINTAFPHWFNRRFRTYNGNEDAMPIDQHSLLALIAPRPLLVMSAEADTWADPLGEFLSLVEVDPVYRLLRGDSLASRDMPPVNTLMRGALGYHIRPGEHGVGVADWMVFIDFANDHFEGR